MQALLGSWPEPPPPCCDVPHAVWDKQSAQVCFNTPLYFFFSQETRPNSWSAMRREEYSAGPQRGRRQEPVEALARQPRAPTGSSTKWRAQMQCLGRKRNPQGLPSNRSPKRRPQRGMPPAHRRTHLPTSLLSLWKGVPPLSSWTGISHSMTLSLVRAWHADCCYGGKH